MNLCFMNEFHLYTWVPLNFIYTFLHVKDNQAVFYINELIKEKLLKIAKMLQTNQEQFF